MKIRKLDAKAVRSTATAASRLSANALRTVTAGLEGERIDPETCAIHFNYPQDALA